MYRLNKNWPLYLYKLNKNCLRVQDFFITTWVGVFLRLVLQHFTAISGPWWAKSRRTSDELFLFQPTHGYCIENILCLYYGWTYLYLCFGSLYYRLFRLFSRPSGVSFAPSNVSLLLINLRLFIYVGIWRQKVEYSTMPPTSNPRRVLWHHTIWSF